MYRATIKWQINAANGQDSSDGVFILSFINNDQLIFNHNVLVYFVIICDLQEVYSTS